MCLEQHRQASYLKAHGIVEQCKSCGETLKRVTWNRLCPACRIKEGRPKKPIPPPEKGKHPVISRSDSELIDLWIDEAIQSRNETPSVQKIIGYVKERLNTHRRLMALSERAA
jgi:uncharacterized Zn finger protein (UPF0148 family)